jgi:hypothetical protein
MERLIAQPDGSVRYVAPAGFSGKDLFSYTIVDATGLTAAGTVTVDVIGSGSFGELMGVLAAAPEGSWVKLNRNLFSEVWTPKDQRPCFGLQPAVQGHHRLGLDGLRLQSWRPDLLGRRTQELLRQ